MLSLSCSYALQAMIYIAANYNGAYIPVSKIAEELNISYHFLKKLVQKLVEADYMASSRGARGGVKPAKPAESITVLDVALLIDKESAFRRCLMNLPSCNEHRPCPLHKEWSDYRQKLAAELQGMSISELARRTSEEKMSIVFPVYAA